MTVDTLISGADRVDANALSRANSETINAREFLKDGSRILIIDEGSLIKSLPQDIITPQGLYRVHWTNIDNEAFLSLPVDAVNLGCVLNEGEGSTNELLQLAHSYIVYLIDRNPNILEVVSHQQLSELIIIDLSKNQIYFVG